MNKLMHKLTLKTFFLLLLLSLSVTLFAYGCIWIFLPYADQKSARRNLARQTEQFVSCLWTTPRSDSTPLFTDFLRQTGAELLLLDQSGETVSPFTFQKTGHSEIVPEARYPFRFADSDDEYALIARYDPTRSDEIRAAVQRSIPHVALLILLLSSVSAFLFSRHMTRPIIRISRIADRIANLDFSWYCPDLRDDEIGILSRSINELSDKLHTALDEIHRRNALLEDEIALEKEREKHLARSAEILQSLNNFIREVLLISHMDMNTEPAVTAVDLSAMTRSLASEYMDYAEPLSIHFSIEIEPGIQIYGDEALLKKALGNVIGNAVTYSPEHGSISIRLTRTQDTAALTVDNAGAHIREEDLPHLFEAFYRAGGSAGHGSGLGLYITRMILENGQVRHTIENTGDGVRFTAVFPAAG